MTRNSSSIPGGNLDAVTVPADDPGQTWHECPICGESKSYRTVCRCDREVEYGPPESLRDDTPVEPAHVAADFEAGYGPYDRDED